MAAEGRTKKDVQHGVDVSAHHEFIDWVAANPKDAMVEFRATGTSEDVVNRTTATISDVGVGADDVGGHRDHTLHFGLPAEMEEAMGYEEAVDRYEAVEGALAGLTACINGTISFNALREGLPVESVETVVRAPLDLRVLLGIYDLDRADEMYGEFEIEVMVTGEDLSDEEMDRIASYPTRSPVYNLVTGAHPTEPDFSFHGTDSSL